MGLFFRFLPIYIFCQYLQGSQKSTENAEKFEGLKSWPTANRFWEKFKIPRVPTAEEFNLLLNSEAPPVENLDISKYEELEMSDGIVTGNLNCGKHK